MNVFYKTVALCLCGTFLATAAVASDLPTTVIPGRDSPLSPLAPALSDEPEGAAPASTAPTSQSEMNGQTMFRLLDVRTSGNTVISDEALRRIASPYLGQTISLLTLDHIARQMTRLYRQNGYFLSRAVIPEQSIRDGVAQIVIVEGYVSEVRIEGDDYRALLEQDKTGVIDRFTRLVTGMKPFNIDQMQRQLLLMNDNGYAAASAIFSALPADNAPVGAAALTLTLAKRPPSLSAGINSYSSNYLGPYHATLGLSSGNLITAWDQIDVSAETSLPLDRMRSLSATYSFPLPFEGPLDGTRAYVGTSLSTMAPGYKLTALDVDGGSEKLFLGLSHNLIRSRDAYAALSLEAQISNSSVSTLGARLYSDRVRKLTATINGGFYDGFKGMNEASFAVSQGLGFGSKGRGDANISRSDGDATFTVLSGSYARTQPVGRSVESYLRLSGQYSATPLLASEEFGFGGISAGRAFDPSEFSGDKGVSALFELRYLSLNTIATLKTIPFVYYDAAKIWNYNLDNSALFASSAGFGLKFLSDYGIVGDVTLAWPLTGEQGAPRWGNGKSPRLLLAVTYQF